MRKLVRTLLPAMVLLGLFGGPAVGRAQTTSDQFAALASHVDTAITLLGEGDVVAARTEYQAFNDGWRDLRLGIRARSRTNAQSIEDAMADVSSALAPDTVDPATAQVALQALRAQADALIGLGPASPQTLTLYSAQHDYATKALVAAFQQRTGISVRVHFGDDAQLANQLDVEGSAEAVGKRTGKDVARGKVTFPGVMGGEAARKRAEALATRASRIANRFDNEGGLALAAIARFAIERKS